MVAMDPQFLICVLLYLLCTIWRTEAFVSFVPRFVGVQEDPCGPTLAALRARGAPGLPDSPHVPQNFPPQRGFQIQPPRGNVQPPTDFPPPQRGNNIQPPIDNFPQPPGHYPPPSMYNVPHPGGHFPSPPIDNVPSPSANVPPERGIQIQPTRGNVQPPTDFPPPQRGNNIQPPIDNIPQLQEHFPPPPIENVPQQSGQLLQLTDNVARTVNILPLTVNGRGPRIRVKRQMAGRTGYAQRQQPIVYDYDLPDFYMPGAGGGVGQPYGSMGQPYGSMGQQYGSAGGGMGPMQDGPDMPYGGGAYPGQMPYGGMPPLGYDADYPMGMYPGPAHPYGYDPLMAALLDLDLPPQTMYTGNQGAYNQYGGAPSYGSPYGPSPYQEPYISPYGSSPSQYPFAPRRYPQTPSWPPPNQRYPDPYALDRVRDVYWPNPSTPRRAPTPNAPRYAPSPTGSSNAKYVVDIQTNTGGDVPGQAQPVSLQNQPTYLDLSAGSAGSVSPGKSNTATQSGGEPVATTGVGAISGQAHSVNHETQAAGTALNAGPVGSADSGMFNSLMQKLDPSISNPVAAVDAGQANAVGITDNTLTHNVNSSSRSNLSAQVGSISAVHNAPSTAAPNITTTTNDPITTTSPSQAGPGLPIVEPGTTGSHGPYGYQNQAAGSSRYGSADPPNQYRDSLLMRSFYNIPPSGGTIPSPTYHVQVPDSRYSQGYYDFSSPTGGSQTLEAPNPWDPYNTRQAGTPYDPVSGYPQWQDPYQSYQSPQTPQSYEPAQNCHCEIAGECYPGPTVAGARYGTQCDARLNLVCCCT